MPTPYPGTIRQPDLENLYVYPKQAWCNVKLTCQFTAITLLISGYNVAACALGRFFLDHFHLWRWSVPAGVTGFDKHAELVTAFVSSVIATPATIGVFWVVILILHEIEKRGVIFQFSDRSLLWIYIVVTWVLLALMGTAFHPRFQHITTVSMLAVYGFGNLLLLLSIVLIGAAAVGGMATLVNLCL
ncbi:hypothetical protein DL96DRAFT_1623242, partial [Flagelloscypha sp. PMI_526]